MPESPEHIEFIHRDGISQLARQSALLDPDYVKIDERTTEDLLSFAKAFAEHLNFVNDQNEVDGNWNGFLGELKDLSDESAFSQPHRALFLTFLKLLGYHRDQMNSFSRRHLDFYYTQLLGFQKRPPVPDQVHALFQLTDEVDQWLLKAGTELDAGTDSQGTELTYTVKEDTLLNQGKVAELRSVYVDKVIQTIRNIRELTPLTSPDGGFMDLLRLAVGDPEPGNALPKLEGITPDYNSLKEVPLVDPSYVDHLYLTLPEFETIFAVQEDWQNTTEADWEPVYRLLEKAHAQKGYAQRRNELKQLRESENDPLVGWETLLSFALGEPGPEDPLPVFKESADPFAEVNQALSSPDRAYAKAFIETDFFMREADFKALWEVRTALTQQQPVTEAAWDQVYAILEVANRAKRQVPFPEARIEKINYIHAHPNAREVHPEGAFDTQEGERWKPFGHSDVAPKEEQPEIGLVLSSPMLEMGEGMRTCNVTFNFREEGYEPYLFTDAGGVPDLFDFALSGAEEWITPDVSYAAAGKFKSGRPYKTPQGLASSPSGDRFNITVDEFGDQDLNQFILTPAGEIFQITDRVSTRSVIIDYRGELSDPQDFPAESGVYTAASVAEFGMRFRLEINEDQAAITRMGEGKGKWPMLRVSLACKEVDGKRINGYQALMDLMLQSAALEVQVTGMREVQVRNDDRLLDPKKPFEVWGPAPASAGSFYLSHPELSGKRLDELSLKVDWMGLPITSLADYYAPYTLLGNTGGGTFPVIHDSDFRVAVEMVDHRSGKPITGTGEQGLALFTTRTEQQTELVNSSVELVLDNIPKRATENAPAYTYRTLPDIESVADPLDAPRYFRFILQNPDFLHRQYPDLVAKRSFLLSEAIANNQASQVTQWAQMDIPLPYTPKIAALTVGYSASWQWESGVQSGIEGEGILHLMPFGYGDLQAETQPYFMPQFPNQGELLIGIENLNTARSLSLLFQTAEGTANPAVNKPAVSWSVLQGGTWKTLADGGLVADKTAGLRNTGILQLILPESASTAHTLMPSGLHWIRATVPENTDAFPDLIDIRTQAVEAILEDKGNAADHFALPLPAESIKGTVENLGEIDQVEQPFSSLKGKPGEDDTLFYTRISERIRHKHRALTPWDYERLVLEHFPAIYKAKCLPGRLIGEKGKIKMVVIPDIRGKQPFFPVEPKVPAAMLEEIRLFLSGVCPYWAEPMVHNPVFVQVKTRFGIKFREGITPGYFLKQLAEDLRRFLSPWAYEEGADIVLGGKIYGNSLVNFIEEQPYTDYVTQLKLFQRVGNEPFRDVRTLSGGENTALTLAPDQVLVTAQQHEIDLISLNGYTAAEFEGINYMKVGLDFLIGSPGN